jgi:fluoride ion exporter CrcB/FEX
MALETFLLVDRGQVVIAASYSLGTVIAGIAALYGGVVLGRVA